MLVTEKFSTPFGDLEVPVHEPVMYGAFKLRGEYCPGEAQTYRALVKPGATVLDIGANIGIFTLAFAQGVGASGRVIAIEPQRSIFEILRKNVQASDVGHIDPRRAIASDHSGTQPFVDIHTLGAEDAAWLGSASVDHAIENANCAMVETDVITIDRLDLPRCDFIKIDVEGHEPQVLAGAWATIKRHKPILAIEAELPDRAYQFIDDLAALGYRFHLMTALYVRAMPSDARDPAATTVRGFQIGGKVSRMLIGVPRSRDQDIPDGLLSRFRPVDDAEDLSCYLRENTTLPDWRPAP